MVAAAVGVRIAVGVVVVVGVVAAVAVAVIMRKPSKEACEHVAAYLETGLGGNAGMWRREVADYLRALHAAPARRLRELEGAAQTAMEALAGILLDVPGVSRTRPDLVVAHDALAEALSAERAKAEEEK